MNVDFQVSADGLEPDLETWFDDIMGQAEVRIKQRTPVKTGALRESINITKEAETYVIGSDKDYFPFIEFGTSTISPVGMVRTTLEELPQIASRTTINWKK